MKPVLATGPLSAQPPSRVPAPAALPPRRLSSQELFGGRQEIEIEHDSQVYRLRRTSLGKLILTK